MDNATQATHTPDETHRPRTGRLTFYHADSKGTGSAAQFELRLNRNGEDRYDCFFLEMARQVTAAKAEHGRTAATFDWAAKVTVKLDFFDICEFLAVLEGKAEQVGGQRNGIYHESGNTNTIIAFKRSKDYGGYFLDISRKDKQGNQVFKGHILLNESEAIGLRCVFQAGLFHMAFNRNIQPG